MLRKKLFGIDESQAQMDHILNESEKNKTPEASEEPIMGERLADDITILEVDDPKNSGMNSVKKTEKNHMRIVDLEEADLVYLCRLMPPKGVRSYFQRHPNDFGRIKPGFRPASLSDDESISLVIRNINRPFISLMVEGFVNEWLTEIQQFQHELVKKGATEEEALIKTLSQCVFSERIDLYYRLKGITYSDDYMNLLKDVVARQTEHNNGNGMHTGDDDYSAKIQVLTEELSEIKACLEAEQQAHAVTASELQSIREERIGLLRNLDEIEAQFRAVTSKTTQMQSELESLKVLAKYADTETFEEDSFTYEYISVCQVYYDQYKGQHRLFRIGDISNGVINRFVRDEEQPFRFGNRDRLYLRDGPQEEGAIGVWRWNAVPKQGDPSSDYVTTSFSKTTRLIQIVELPECKTLKDVTDYLLNHTIAMQASKKLFFALAEANGRIAGLLCNESDFDTVNGNIKLKDNVYTLPQFIISATDIVTLAGKRFYRATSLGSPQDIYRLRSPILVVKDIVVNRATNATLRLLGLSKKEAQHCQRFLKDMPVSELAAEVAEAYDCSIEEAIEYVSTFINNATSYLNDNDVDTDTLARAITRAPELFQRCKDTLREDWMAENAAAISASREQLEQIEQLVTERKLQYDADVVKHTKLFEELIRVENEIENKQALIADVEANVAVRMENAKKNVAAFVSEMAFANAYANTYSTEGSVKKENPKKVVFTRKNPPGTPVENLDCIEDFVDELTENLKACGYESTTSVHMAQTIAFCITNKTPIICGANTELVADCIAAMFASEGVISVTLPIGAEDYGEYYCEIASECKEKQNIFVINGVFDGFSLNLFNEVLQQYSSWHISPILILSMHGVSKEAVPRYVWEKAMYIDGDAGFVNLPGNGITVFRSDFKFEAAYTADEYKNKRKLFKPYADYVSNTAMMQYAKYLVFSSSTINTDPIIQIQILLNALSVRRKDELVLLLESEGINIRTNEFLKGYV